MVSPDGAELSAVLARWLATRRESRPSEPCRVAMPTCSGRGVSPRLEQAHYLADLVAGRLSIAAAHVGRVVRTWLITDELEQARLSATSVLFELTQVNRELDRWQGEA